MKYTIRKDKVITLPWYEYYLCTVLDWFLDGPLVNHDDWWISNFLAGIQLNITLIEEDKESA